MIMDIAQFISMPRLRGIECSRWELADQTRRAAGRIGDPRALRAGVRRGGPRRVRRMGMPTTPVATTMDQTMNIEALSHWLFISAPQHAQNLTRWYAMHLHFFARAIGDTANRATQFLLRVITSSETSPNDGWNNFSLHKEGKSKHMKPNRKKIAPSMVPESPAVTGATLTPGSLLRAFVTVFAEHYAQADQRADARDLDWILSGDPSAADDILDAMFHDRTPPAMTPAGMNTLVYGLVRVGAFETRDGAVSPADVRVLSFRARPLLDLLKALPHRDPGLGIRRELVEDCTTTETEN
jgi:hypothetical protein